MIFVLSISEQLMGNLSNVYNLRLNQNECEKHMQYMHVYGYIQWYVHCIFVKLLLFYRCRHKIF